MSLFRPESQEARASAWLGRVLLARPLSFAVMTAVSIGFAIVLAAYFTLGDYTRKARIHGALAPAEGVMRIVAQQPGRVAELAIVEGRHVARDEMLLAVVDGRASDSFEDIGRAIAGRVAQRLSALARQREFVLSAMAAEQASLAQRREGLGHELEQLDREIASQTARLELSARAVARMRRLESVGFVTASASDRESEAALEHETRIEAMRRTRIALTRERSALVYEMSAAQARARAQLAGIDIQRAALEQERIERELQHRLTITAPAAGIVATVLVEAGQAISTGATLATIIPESGELEAHLYAPSRSVGFVRPGQDVLLRYPAYPHQKFGSHRGRIASISRNAMPPGELGFTPADGSREPLYRIKVALASQSIDAYGRAEALRAGMQVEADVLLDRRRLIEWIFEPLLSLAGRA